MTTALAPLAFFAPTSGWVHRFFRSHFRLGTPLFSLPLPAGYTAFFAPTFGWVHRFSLLYDFAKEYARCCLVFYFSILFHILSFVNTNSVLLPGKGTFGFRTIPADAAWALPLQCADFLGFIGFFRVDRG